MFYRSTDFDSRVCTLMRDLGFFFASHVKVYSPLHYFLSQQSSLETSRIKASHATWWISSFKVAHKFNVASEV